MKHISKNPAEPQAFADWKAANQEQIGRYHTDNATGDRIWSLLPSSLPNPETGVEEVALYSKAQLRKTLLIEQGYLCCYCNQRIEDDHTTPIEHFRPKGMDSYRHQVFDYQNLLACCDGGERDTTKPRETWCTLFKGSKDPMHPDRIISPLEPNCMELFEFDEQGQIFPTNQNDRAEKTIAFLGLRAKRLRLQRHEAIDTYIFDVWTEDMDTAAELDRLMTPINGRLEPFCSAIHSILRHYP